MDSTSSDAGRGAGRSCDEPGTAGATRRAVLAAGGALALGGLAGCSALDGLIDSGSEQVVGTRVSAPAALYVGRPPSDASDAGDGTPENDEATQFVATGQSDVRRVPATVRVDSREIDLEGWSNSGVTKAQDYNSSRSNKRKTEWWAGPDDDDEDDDDGDGFPLLEAHAVEIELLGHVTAARNAVSREDRDGARGSLDAFINVTMQSLRPALERCDAGVCATVRENSDGRVKGIRIAREAVDEGDWTAAERELAGVDEIVLGDIERLDDALVERRPGRPKYSDFLRYLRGEPTIGERFTVCLPDATLPGDRGSLAAELTLDRVLAYFAPSRGPDGLRTPFGDRYDIEGVEYDEDGCIVLDGPISLHRDVACGDILSAELDTYTTANRGMVGFGTEGGAVVSAALASSGTIGNPIFVANGATGEMPDDDRGMVMPGNSDGDGGSLSPTLVCPVTVTPHDSPSPLPGIFYVQRVVHDDQIVLAGGWVLDEGALYEDSATLLFAEGPTEVASVTPEDVGSDDFDDRIVEQFSRERSERGSVVMSGKFATGNFPKEWTLPAMDRAEGRNGLDAVYATVIGEQGDDFDDPDDDGDGILTYTSATALDAPLVHLDGARELSDEEKLATEAGIGGKKGYDVYRPNR